MAFFWGAAAQDAEEIRAQVHFTELVDNLDEQSIFLCLIPANCQVVAVRAMLQNTFSGPDAETLTCKIVAIWPPYDGSSQDYTDYLDCLRLPPLPGTLYQAFVDSLAARGAAFGIAACEYPVVAQFNITGQNFGDGTNSLLSSGDLMVWIRYVRLGPELAYTPGTYDSYLFIDPDAGDDTHDGLSPATAWLTWAPLTPEMLEAGAGVLVLIGGVWTDYTEQLTAAAALLFDPYPGVFDDALGIFDFPGVPVPPPIMPPG